MVSHPMADASARMICPGFACFSSRMTAATTSGLVLTELSGAPSWPAFGLTTTVEPGRIRDLTPPR